MLQCNIKKWSAQLDRLMQKGEPWRRKQYKKARFRKRASRYKLYSEIDYAESTMNEPWEWKYHQIWVL